jgi:predicted RNA binding protein with dsRBD fold (UPF0201 family)
MDLRLYQGPAAPVVNPGGPSVNPQPQTGGDNALAQANQRLGATIMDGVFQLAGRAVQRRIKTESDRLTSEAMDLIAKYQGEDANQNYGPYAPEPNTVAIEDEDGNFLRWEEQPSFKNAQDRAKALQDEIDTLLENPENKWMPKYYKDELANQLSYENTEYERNLIVNATAAFTAGQVQEAQVAMIEAASAGRHRQAYRIIAGLLEDHSISAAVGVEFREKVDAILGYSAADSSARSEYANSAQGNDEGIGDLGVARGAINRGQILQEFFANADSMGLPALKDENGNEIPNTKISATEMTSNLFVMAAANPDLQERLDQQIAHYAAGTEHTEYQKVPRDMVMAAMLGQLSDQNEEKIMAQVEQEHNLRRDAAYRTAVETVNTTHVDSFLPNRDTITTAEVDALVEDLGSIVKYTPVRTLVDSWYADLDRRDAANARAAAQGAPSPADDTNPAHPLVTQFFQDYAENPRTTTDMITELLQKSANDGKVVIAGETWAFDEYTRRYIQDQVLGFKTDKDGHGYYDMNNTDRELYAILQKAHDLVQVTHGMRNASTDMEKDFMEQAGRNNRNIDEVRRQSNLYLERIREFIRRSNIQDEQDIDAFREMVRAASVNLYQAAVKGTLGVNEDPANYDIRNSRNWDYNDDEIGKTLELILQIENNDRVAMETETERIVAELRVQGLNALTGSLNTAYPQIDIIKAPTTARQRPTWYIAGSSTYNPTYLENGRVMIGIGANENDIVWKVFNYEIQDWEELTPKVRETLGPWAESLRVAPDPGLVNDISAGRRMVEGDLALPYGGQRSAYTDSVLGEAIMGGNSTTNTRQEDEDEEFALPEEFQETRPSDSRRRIQ